MLNYNDFIIDGESEKNIIKSIYKNNYKKNYNFISYLTNLNNNSYINIIYTFSDKKSILFYDNYEIPNTNFAAHKTLTWDLNENIEIGNFSDKIKDTKYNLVIIKFEEKNAKNFFYLKI